MAKKPTKATKIIFPWMRRASRSSRLSWQRRWEKAAQEGRPVGPKGLDYLKRLGPSLVPSKIRRDEDDEVQFLPPRKASRFVFVEEPIGRLKGKTKKKKGRR